MIEASNSEGTASENGDSSDDNHKADSAEKYRNPRATRKGPDMPEDLDGHRTDPETDYVKPDGSERRP